MATYAAAQTTFYFDDNTLASESHWGGAGSGETDFTSGDWYFPHNDGTYSWDGFVYSNETDTTTAGYTNQFSAITGGGVGGSENYGVSCIPLNWMGGTYDPIPRTISAMDAAYDATLDGFYVTNTTYAYLSMLNGDSVAKKFGGTTGDDPDYFKLIIKGIDAMGEYTASTVDFYLADFRFTDNSQDYIINEWTWVDTSGLGDVIGLEFSLDSSDSGAYGINTPTYFAMDVPEPATMSLLAIGAMALLRRRRRA
ncbi:MAG: DUF4465 domain-containing protein [Phycisphaerae bacterium]|nr:DUF4465 domain-containing protein [Phycisphaerae bacterium]